jgi:hypothetical protein
MVLADTDNGMIGLRQKMPHLPIRLITAASSTDHWSEQLTIS